MSQQFFRSLFSCQALGNLKECSTMMNEETILDFGLKVRQFRTALALKVEDLAALSGLKVSEIIAIEQGTFPLTHPVVAALVEALIDAPSMLFQTPAAGPTKGSLSADTGTVAGGLFDAASPEVQEATLSLLREIAKAGVSPPANSPSN
jgi:transcriptional regulator with XRE-family HTH domain